MRKTLQIVLAVAMIGSFARSAQAGTIGFIFDTVFSNTTSPGPTPWAGVLFNDAPVGGITPGFDVRMTIFTNGPTTGLIGTEFLTETDFNINILSAANAGQFSSRLVSATNGAAGAIGSAPMSFGFNAFKADGDGFYDMSMNFSSNPPRATTGNVYVIDIGWSGGALLASNFNAFSAPGGGAGGPFYAATHIQGIPYGDGSTWGGASRIPCVNCATPFDEPGGTVPEPTSMLLLGTGLLSAAKFARKRKA